MDIDDTFTPDDAWSIATHSNDYTDADSLRMSAADVVNAAQWSQANDFRLDQLFNGGGSVEYQNGQLVPGPARTRPGPGPVPGDRPDHRRALRRRLRLDQPHLRHPLPRCGLCHPELHRGRAQREHQLGGARRRGPPPGPAAWASPSRPTTADALGTENPQVFVPGNHSGLADLVPGTPATVDPPDLDAENVNATGGTLAAGNYQYAVTDQFNASDSPSVDQSQAYVTVPITVPAGGSVSPGVAGHLPRRQLPHLPRGGRLQQLVADRHLPDTPPRPRCPTTARATRPRPPT